MKNLIALLLAAALLWPASVVWAKEKLAVMDLEATYGIGDDLTWALSDYLRGEIFAQGEYEVVSKSDLAALAKRTSLQQQAGICTDTACLAELGKALGTKYMVYGSISKAGKLYIISLSLLDTVGKDAGVKNRINESCTCSEEQLFGSMQRAATKIMGKAVAKKVELATAAAGGNIPARESKPGDHEMIEVKGGCFQMGSPASEKDRDSDEGPLHEVCVDGFQMGKYEVTNRQYRQFKPDHDSKDYEGNSMNGDNQPVVYVSWDDAVGYTRWLSSKTGQNFRLPTEAEWEYAARAGTTTARFWGDNPDNACGFANVFDQTSKRVNKKFTSANHNCDDGYALTAQVGSFKANGFGFYDLLGNVWEWTNDWYGKDYYGNSSRQNPTGPSSGSGRVRRGSSWYDGPGGVRSANRYWFSPGDRDSGLGFRLVLSPDQ